jgi:hypothetical protein
MCHRTLFCLTIIAASASTRAAEPAPRLGEKVARAGDEIMVCGQLYHTTTKVILWTDPGGYDAYRTDRRFAPLNESSWKATFAAVPDFKSGNPNRYRGRLRGLTPEEVERVRGGAWDLPTLQKQVDQFVIHYDVVGTSRGCFRILQDVRGLSVHFMLDNDGTLYQTLDLKESAYHATIANDRSIGIEITNIGAYPPNEASVLDTWYHKDADGGTRLTIPDKAAKADGPVTSAVLRPSRPEPVTGLVQGQTLKQYDFTPEQYRALARLTATLCSIFPKLRCDYPRDSAGKLLDHKIPDGEYARYQGILGHFHVQTNKTDPGPAFQWDNFLEETRSLLPGSRAK